MNWFVRSFFHGIHKVQILFSRLIAIEITTEMFAVMDFEQHTLFAVLPREGVSLLMTLATSVATAKKKKKTNK